MKGLREHLLTLLPLAVCMACGGSQSTAKNASPHVHTAKPVDRSSSEAASASDAQANTPPTFNSSCGDFDSEAAAMNQVLSLCGSGLVWLVLPAAAQDGSVNEKDLREAQKRSEDDIHKARKLAECLLHEINAGFDQTEEQGFESLEAWVDEHVTGKHPKLLLAAGAAYFASLMVADSLFDAVLDIPAARLFLERSIAADPSLYDGLGPMLIGAYECFMPKPIGGQPEQGLARLEEAAAAPGRFRLAMKVVAAELCAYSLQDRKLFDRLIDEILHGPRGTDTMIDMMAQAHAKSLLADADELFALAEDD